MHNGVFTEDDVKGAVFKRQRSRPDLLQRNLAFQTFFFNQLLRPGQYVGLDVYRRNLSRVISFNDVHVDAPGSATDIKYVFAGQIDIGQGQVNFRTAAGRKIAFTPDTLVEGYKTVAVVRFLRLGHDAVPALTPGAARTHRPSASRSAMARRIP